MAWEGRPREEGTGGNSIRRKNRAWAFAKRGLVPDSKADKNQTNNLTTERASYRAVNRVKNGLVCEWWFDEGTGTVIEDKSVGTIQSDLQWISVLGGAWSVDAAQNDRYFLNLSGDGGGVRNTGSVEPVNEPARTNEATFEAWFSPADQAGLATSGPGRIGIVTPANNGYIDQCLMLGHGTWTGNSSHNNRSYSARIKVGGTTYSLWSANDTAVTDQLVHLVVTGKHDGVDTAEIKFYVDGTEVDSKDIATLDTEIFDEWDLASRISFGCDRDGEKKAPGGLYLGAVYNRALTSAEVQQNFEEGVSPRNDTAQNKDVRAIFKKTLSEIEAGKTDTMSVTLSGTGLTRIATVTLTASDNGGLTYGTDYTLDPTSVTFEDGQTIRTVTLSTVDTIPDATVIRPMIDTFTGAVNPVTPSDETGVDGFDITVDGITVLPDLKISYDQNPTVMPTTDQPAVGVFTVTKTRPFADQIEFAFDGSADVNNVADYYFLSGGAPGVFSAPFQPSPFVNCGHNNDYLINTLGYNGGVAPTLTAYTGPSIITVDGTTIQDKIITGTIDIRADNVTIKNCKIQGSSSDDYLTFPLYCLKAVEGGLNLLIEDCEITKGDSSNMYIENAIVRRCYIHKTHSDLIKTISGEGGRGRTTVESCYFADMGNTAVAPGAHADVWQHRGPGGNLVCRWNYFDVPGNAATPATKVHSAGIIWQNKGTVGAGWLENLVVDSNWFKGGSNACYFTTRDGNVREAYAINNIFIGDYDMYDDPDGIPWFKNLLLIGENQGFTVDYKSYNNRLSDGTLAWKDHRGPFGPGATAGLCDNVTSPPSIPFYDSPNGTKVDLSDGIILPIGPSEMSRVVNVYCEPTDSQGVFVDGDVIRGFLQSGSVVTGDDAGTSLSVCSTLSTLDVEFDTTGFLRSNNDTNQGPNVSIATQESDDRDRVENVTITSPTFRLEGLDDNEIFNRIELPPVGGETSGTTGNRVAVSDHPHKALCWFVDPGQDNAANKIAVPQGGLIVSAYHFTEVRIKTTNPLKFIDCQFSGQTDFHGGITQNYVVWDNNQGGGDINKKVDFEYCDFQGGSKTIMMNWRTLHKCSFNDTIGDYIRFRNGNYRITNCWFGPHMKYPDSALNGNNGNYNTNQGINPHADPMQIFMTDNDRVHVTDCTFAGRPANWSDGTTNPTHALGAYPDKILQYGGVNGNPAGDLGEFRFTNCILGGGGNYMIAAAGPNKAQPGIFSFKDCKFGTNFRSGFFGSVDSQHTRVDLGGNVWYETGTPGIRLPQEALNAGTTTDAGRDNLPISYVIRGLDNISFNKDGLNEGGKTPWGERGTPLS